MSSSDYFGPALPPGFTQSVSDTSKTDLSVQSAEKDSPKRRHSSHDSSNASSSSSSSSASKCSENVNQSRSHTSSADADAVSSPAASSCRIIGPVIPEGIQPSAAVSTEEPSAVVFIGPVIPGSLVASQVEPEPTAETNDDDDLVGPMPVADPVAREQAALEQIEQRAKLMKDKLLGNDLPDPSSEIATRETWMTELPPEMKKNFGVTARTFSTKAPTSLDKDRSAWTDTPADRARKEQELREGKTPAAAKVAPEAAAISAQDETYRGMVDEYNRLTRPKSLLEMHDEKLHKKSHKSHHSKKRKRKESEATEGDEKDRKKKKKKKHGKRKHRDDHDSDSETSSDSGEHKKKKKKKKDKEKKKGAAAEPRRPFDREKDLSIVKMNDAQRKSVIQRSQELTGRFGHGGTQFL